MDFIIGMVKMNERALLLSEGGCNAPPNLRMQSYLQGEDV